MKLKLPANLYAPDQLRYCAEELYAYATAGRQRRRGATVPEPALSAESRSLLAGLTADQRNDFDALEALAAELETLLAGDSDVSVTLAALPSHALKEELVSWLRAATRENLLVSFHVNPDIGGGMVLRTFNRVHDFSFRRLLLAHPERFTKALQDVR
jgi:hypothetical protein